MRVVAIAVLAALVVVSAALQAIAGVALRDRAAQGAWMRLLSPSLAASLDAFEPHAFFPEELRRILGETALRRGDTGRAERFADSLQPGPDRESLLGAIADAEGDRATAVAAYLAAGDVARLEANVDRRVAAHDVVGAVALQEALVTRLNATQAQSDTVAEAMYRLGNVLQQQAYAIAPGVPERRLWEVRARDAYADAARRAPLELRYAIALGNQLLNVGDLAGARGVFLQARVVDPTSIEPLTGLADAALRAHDPAQARRYLDMARDIAPASPAVIDMSRRAGI